VLNEHLMATNRRIHGSHAQKGGSNAGTSQVKTRGHARD
jgi:hypothetical protein